jgi:hypothetical protein
MGTLRKIIKALAVGLYLVVMRTVLSVAVLLPSLYFILNSSPFPGHLSQFLRSVLPGSIEFSTLQISPIPWQLDILDVRITTPEGEEVIRVGTLRVSVDLVPLLRFVAQETPDIIVHLWEVRLFDYEAHIDFNADGHLRLVDAFSRPSKPKPATVPKRNVHLVFDRVVGVGGVGRVSFPEWDLRVEDLDLQARFDLVTAPHTRVRVDASTVGWTHGFGNIRAAPGVSAIPRQVDLGPGRVTGFVYDWDRISFDLANMVFPGMTLEAKNGFLAWSENLRYEGEAELLFDGDSQLVTTATGGLLKGPIRLEVEGRGDRFDPRLQVAMDSPSLSINGMELGHVELAASGGRDETGRYAFQGIRALTDSLHGRLELDGGVFYPFGSADGLAADTAFAVQAQGFSIPELMKSLGLVLPPAWVPLPRSVSGRMQVRADVASWATGIGFARTSGRFEALLPKGSVLAGDDAEVRFDASMTVDGDMARPSIQIEELSVQSGPDRVRAKGTVDLVQGSMDVTGAVAKDLASLAPLLGRKISGRLGLEDLNVRGQFRALTAMARMNLKALSVASWEVLDAHAEVEWRDGAVALSDVEAATPFGAIALSRGSLQLLDPRSGGKSRSMHMTVKKAVIPSLDLARLPPLKDSGIKGRANVVIDSLELDLLNPVRTLGGSIKLSLPRMTAEGRALADVEVEASAADGIVTLPLIKIPFKAGGVARLSGSMDLQAGTFDASLDGQDLPLSALAGMKKDDALKGTLNVRATAGGRYADPTLVARADGHGVAWGDQHLGDISLDLTRKAGGDLVLASDQFFPGMHLGEGSRITWGDGRFTGLVLAVDMNRLTLQDVFPTLRPRDLWGEFSGNVQMQMGFGPNGVLEASLTLPPDGMHLGFFENEVQLRNVEKLVARVQRDGSVSVQGLAIDDGRGVLRACGTLLDADGQMNLWVQGPVGAYWLRKVGTVVSLADGYMHVGGRPGFQAGPPPEGCDSRAGAGEGSMIIRGTFAKPVADGELRTNSLELGFRGLGNTVHLQEGGRILLSSESGSLSASIAQEHMLRGTWGDGTFAIQGSTTFDGLVPAEGELILEGSQLRYMSPGQFFLEGNLALRAKFEGLGLPGQSRTSISGRVAVTDGSYYKNFDIVGRAFSGMSGARVAQRQGRSLEDVVPWLADADLDVAVTGPRFGVRSKLSVGSTDFDIALDLRVRGKLKAPELWNRVEVLPGGTFTYQLVRRVFEVVRGTVDFEGNISRPRVDLSARTRVDLKGASSSSTGVASRFDPDLSGSDEFEQGILVNLRASGRYPDLDISLTSNAKAYTQTELQYVLLTGTDPQSSGSSSQFFSLGLLTDDVPKMVSKLLLGSLVDAVSLGFSPSGGLNLDLSAHIGSRLKFGTRVMQESGSPSYRAGFQVRLTDYLSLEGRIRSDSPATGEGSQDGVKYETKLRFRIPVE